MYIRLSRLSCDPAHCDEVLASAEQTNPALRNLPGLQSSYWGVDRATGAMIAVSVWDTRAHASFSRDDLIAAAGRSGSPNAGPAAEQRLELSGVRMDPPELFELAANIS
jgi:heme-degrading monooxygenase HmoA